MTPFLVYLAKRKNELRLELLTLNASDALAQRLLIRRSANEVDGLIEMLPEDMRMLVNELADLLAEG